MPWTYLSRAFPNGGIVLDYVQMKVDLTHSEKESEHFGEIPFLLSPRNDVICVLRRMTLSNHLFSWIFYLEPKQGWVVDRLHENFNC